jgi:hypothetical protein
MPRKRTESSRRYGLPEVPKGVSDVDSSRRDRYKRLRKLGTQAYDVREIIYHHRELTQEKLKEELRKYGYGIPHGDQAGDGGTLVVLEEETEEITREGSKNATKITWEGEISSDSPPTKEQPSEYLQKEDEVTWVENNSGEDVDLPTHENVDVLSHATISKDGEWWKAIVRYDHYGEERVAVYLWRKNGDGDWTRKQKYSPRSPEDWERDKQIVEEGIGKTD